MKILGINVGHDSGAALIVNSNLIAAVNEERLSRIKMYHGTPYMSINEVLNIGNIKLSEIDVICIEGKLIAPIDHVDYTTTNKGKSQDIKKKNYSIIEY